MIASLPMYDWPELREHVDHFWKTLHPALQLICKTAPQQLDRTDLHAQWQQDDLLLSQTCAYPLVTSLPSTTVVVGTPNYQCDFSENGFYASPILVRQSDNRKSLAEFAHSTLAYNGTESQSGFNAFKSLLVEQQLINNENNLFFFQLNLCGVTSWFYRSCGSWQSRYLRS